jgi:hypothetical protein
MSDLSSSLTKLNPKQKLFVLRGSPEKVIPLVFKEWGITHLVFEKVSQPAPDRVEWEKQRQAYWFDHVCRLLGQDTAAYARQRDELIFSLVKEEFPHIKVIVKHGHNLYDPEEVIKKGNGGKVITTLMSWKKVSGSC